MPAAFRRGAKRKLARRFGSGFFARHASYSGRAASESGPLKDILVFEEARRLRSYGERERYDSVRSGWNSRLDTVQWGADRLRVGPWRGDHHIAYIAPTPGRPGGSGSGGP